MASLRTLVIDRWSALSHKLPMKDDPTGRQAARRAGFAIPAWIGEEHRHRISAYVMLDGYLANTARAFLDTSDLEDRDQRREYGDPGLIRDEILSALLGKEQMIVVPGAEEFDPDLPEPGAQLADGQTATDEETWNENLAAEVLAEHQAFLQQWAIDTHFTMRLVDCESNAVGLGDGVWLLGWDQEKGRPVPAVMHPGFYFPVLADSIDAYEYPTRVHFAWQLPAEDFDDDKERVRRITYELVDLEIIAELDEVSGEIVDVLPEDAQVEVVDGVRRVVRQYPWNDAPTTKVCVVTDARWKLDDIDDAPDIDGLNLAHAEHFEEDEDGPIVERDLLIDFIPVVHEPNTTPGGEHYGESSLARVAQVLDDLASADTDSQAASATTGSPITWSVKGPGRDDPLTGMRRSQLEVKPGAHWPLGEGGTAGVLDTASNLAATREYVEQLLNRLARNSRLPAALLGLIKPSEVPSGIALQLSFGPLESMIRNMRLVRSVKHPLLLKMVHRLYMANAPELVTPEHVDAEIALGTFLPQDKAAVATMVAGAYKDKMISLETAVRMLQEAGWTIDDVAEEVARIQEADYETASLIADVALPESLDLIRTFLHLEAPATVPEPAPGPLLQ